MGRLKLLKETQMNEYRKDDAHIYTPSGTDIQQRWRLKYGWVPPSELPEYQKKWAYYQELSLRRLDDEAKKEFERVMKNNKVTRWKTV
jgi:hypothetical protein